MSTSGFNTSFGGPVQNSLGNTLTSERKNLPEYKKIFCAYHPTQFLTNFCMDPQCLMPLCPTCVVEHTQQHYQAGTRPQYVNLHDTLQDSKQKCYSSIVQLQQMGRKNIQISNYLTGLPQYIRKQLYDCKEKIYHLIDSKFQSLEQELITQIRQKYSQDNVYNRKQSDQVKDYINSLISSLYQKITNLKGDQCLAALIRYYQSQEKGFQNDLDQINEYIHRNQKAGGIFISLNEEALHKQFQNLTDKVVNLEYVHPQQTRSFNSTFQQQHLGSSKKGLLNSSVATKLRGSRSGVKEKSLHKALKNSQVNSNSRQQQKGSYGSPFTPLAQF